jgi:hypothetical protein
MPISVLEELRGDVQAFAGQFPVVGFDAGTMK